jgi:outer membrane protein OmpA-like peptidoglycan-associated protein
MMDSSREAPEPDERELGDPPVNSHGKLALALGVIALTLSLVLGCVYLISVRRLEREVARLSQQADGLSRQVVRAQEQSQTFAQQASQAAANAQAAAQQSDLAKQDQSNSEAQAQLAREQAAASQQKADQATQQAQQATQQAEQATKQAEQLRQQREAELAQLQQALGQIAETHRTAMGLVMTLDSKSIRFDFDKANIKPEYRDTLNRIAGVLMTLKGFSIAVYGYTDDVGTQTYNLQLSQRRAEAVRDFLLQTGLSPTTVTRAKGFGKADPRVPGDSEQARAANRRVEIGIVDTKLITNGAVDVPK